MSVGAETPDIPDYSNEAYHYNKDVHRYNWDMATDQHAETLKINAQVRADRREQRDHKYDIDMEQWRYANQSKKLKEDYEDLAWRKAQDYKRDQDNLNRNIYDHSIEANETVQRERLQEQTHKLSRDLLEKEQKTLKARLAGRAAKLKEWERSDAVKIGEEKAALAERQKLDEITIAEKKVELTEQQQREGLLYAGLKAELQLRTTEFGHREKRELLTLAEHQKRAKLALDNQENFIKDLKALGQVKATGKTGRITDKFVYEVIASKGRRDRALFDMATRSSDQYNAAVYGIDNAILAASNSVGLSKQEFRDKLVTLTQEKIDALEGMQARRYTTTAEKELTIKKLDWEKGVIAEELAISETAEDIEILGITTAYNITHEEARDTLASIKNARYNADKEDEYKKSGADLQAWARMGLEIPIGPAIPEPTKLPLTAILDPPSPEKPPQPVKGAGMAYTSGRANAGVTTGQAISAGLGVAAAIPGPQQPFVAGAALLAGLFDW